MSTTANSSARQRIEALLDENSFVEIGAMVKSRNTDFNMQTKETPADGVITGYGVINDKLVYVYSQDASVLGGSVGEMHAKKIINLYNMAMKMGAPVIGMIDSSGLRLQEATDGLNAFGRIYQKQVMASGVVLQISGIFGNCGGGLSVIPALSDFTLMENSAKMYVNTPDSIDGNRKDVCDTASAQFKSEDTGLVDFTGSEEEIIAYIRELVTVLPANNAVEADYCDCSDELNRACQGIENCVEDPYMIASMISDNGYCLETKKDFAKEMFTGFIRLNGSIIGVVANRTAKYDENGEKVFEHNDKLTVSGCDKASDFINYCDSFGIPVITLTNVTGFDSKCICTEKKMAKAVAGMVYAYTNATVPKVNVITGNAFGSAYLTMGAKSLGADVVYAWPDAKVGMMDAKEAVKIIYSEESDRSIIASKAEEYNDLQASVLSAASHGYIDTVISPEDSRKYIIGALEMLYTKTEDRPVRKHGTI